MTKISLTDQQAKVFKMLREGDCLVDTGRRWGKTVLAQSLAANWSLGASDKPLNVIVVEPNYKMADMFISGFQDPFSGMISKINRNDNVIFLKNNYKIKICVLDTDWHSDLFRGYDGIIVDEYGNYINPWRNSLKKLLHYIPLKFVKCFLGTPTGALETYLLRKWIFNSKSFHFYRFPTPKEALPDNLKDILTSEQYESEVAGNIPADPTSIPVHRLSSSIEVMSEQIKNLTQELNLCKLQLEEIQKYTLE